MVRRLQAPYLFLCGALLLLLPSCVHDRAPIGMQDASFQELAAKLHDVPIFSGAKNICYSKAAPQLHEGVMVSYTCMQDSMMIYSFYTVQMEQAGWRLISSFLGPEMLMEFEKPRSSCIVSMRPGKNGIRIVIFVGKKKYGW